MLVIDAHEDIAWNILNFGRDYTHNAAWLRAREAGTLVPQHNGNTLLGLENWITGHVAVIIATLFVAPIRKRLGPWDAQCYDGQEHAAALAARQLDAYTRLANNHPQFRLILTRRDLAQVLRTWRTDGAPQSRVIGLVTLMEGADPILDPGHLDEWHASGVRIIGPAWEATRYAGGTHEPGPLTADGRRLLASMSSRGLILDLSHMAEEAYYQAIEAYNGVTIASHANPRRFLPTPRGLSDEMITLLAERDGVVGLTPYNAFMKPGWVKGDPREQVHISDVVSMIDHVCQLTGTSRYVGLGSDFDGGFGVEHVPVGIDTVADLLKLADLLHEKGYTESQIQDILGLNWLRVLHSGLP